MNNALRIISSADLLKDAEWVGAITRRKGLAEETAHIITAARIRMKLTQAELAKKIQTTQSVIARAESGKSLPGLSFIARLAKAYGTPVRIVFESMPDIVPVAVRYERLSHSDSSRSAAQDVTRFKIEGPTFHGAIDTASQKKELAFA